MRPRRSQLVGLWLSRAILIAASLTILLPLLWIARTSFVNKLMAYKIPPVWFFKPTMDNYVAIFQQYPFQQFFLNSFLISTAASLFTLVLATLAAYSIARFKTGEPYLRLSMLSTQMLPPIVLVIPIFLLAKAVGLWGSRWGLIVAYLSFNLPYTIWILTGFFQSVPVDLEEAAMIDGCSRVKAIWKVVLPVSLPGLFSAGIFCFIVGWNEFLFALLLTGRESKTLPVAISALWTQQGVQIGAVSAATMLVILPVILITLLSYKSLIHNLSRGAVK